jgi:hypothetical protein
MSAFQECWERVERAEAHAKAVVDACEALLGDKAYKVVPQMRNQRDGEIVIRPTFAVDNQLSFRLGEFFYQLRAALDSTMWKAYEILGFSDPSTDEKHLYFPIHTGKAKSFDNATFQGVNLPQELSAWLRSIQPCFAHEHAPDSDMAIMAETLRVINDCATFDRHRKLHLIGGYVSLSSAKVRVTPPAEVIDTRAITTGDYFKNEFVVAEFTVEGLTSGTEIAGEGQFAITVSVDQIPKSMGDFLGVQLHTMSNNTKVVIQKFDSLIP